MELLHYIDKRMKTFEDWQLRVGARDADVDLDIKTLQLCVLAHRILSI